MSDSIQSVNSGKVQEQNIIPITTRAPLSDQNQLYSATPGGTLFSTTPGGTRIIYGRDFLMNCRNSPISQTPPVNLPSIPGVTDLNCQHQDQMGKIIEEPENPKLTSDEAQFQMDI